LILLVNIALLWLTTFSFHNLTFAGQHALHSAHQFTYAAFAEHLHHLLRLFELAQQLINVHHLNPRSGGDAAGTASTTASGGSTGGGPATAEDRRAQIDRRFDETFAVFDERMRKEQEAISQDRAARGTGSGQGSAGESDASGEGEQGDAAGESGSEDGEGGESGDGSEAGSESGGGPSAGGAPGGRGTPAGNSSGQQGGGGGVGGGGPLGGAGPNTVPADIPDGRDDDIVARQLREAAIKETDPELRERLWEEYRQYKKSTQ